MASIARATMTRRRQRQEEGYEGILVRMAREIVDDKTTPERREQCQESLLSACVKVAEFHSMSASALYRGAIRRAISNNPD